MKLLPLLDALICAAICLRLLLFRRGAGVHRPRASLVAYLLIVAAGAAAVLPLFGLDAGLPRLALHLALLAALVAARGNVVELFRRTDAADPSALQLIRRPTWL